MAKAKKLPSGNWRCQIRKKINGQIVSKSFTAETRKEAERQALLWEAQETYNPSMPLREAYKRYIQSKENVLSPGTVREYLLKVDRELQTIMDVPIDKLTREQIQIAINQEAATHSPKTVANIHGMLSSVLKMFRPEFILNTKLPQKRKVPMYIPTDEDVNHIIQATKGTFMEVAILLAAFGPMRRGELCAITKKDIIGNTVTVNKAYIQDKNKEWVIKPPKNYSSNRTIVYPRFVIDVLEKAQDPIIPINPDALTKRFARILKKNNIPYFKFHALRHYNVSICKAMNIPDEYIMARGGWSTNYTMNNVYSHILNDVQDKITTQILDHFDSVNAHKLLTEEIETA